MENILKILGRRNINDEIFLKDKDMVVCIVFFLIINYIFFYLR